MDPVPHVRHGAPGASTDHVHRHRPCEHARHGEHGWSRRLASHPVLLALPALAWLIVRTGGKPTRLAYPCQQAALGSLSLAYSAAFAPWLCRLARWLRDRRLHVAALGGLLVALALVGPSDTVIGQSRSTHHALTAADYEADVYVVPNAGGPVGDRHAGVDALIAGMGSNGVKFYRTPVGGIDAGPQGIVRADDVVLIKVNCQWAERGGTNTDLLKGLITRILEHPDGFRGEVVVVDNGQGIGSFDWSAANAEDHGQSVADVVRHFAALGEPVSSYLWDGIRGTSVADWDAGDLRDGYVVGNWDNASASRVSYPKFRTAGGRYVSLAHGIWDPGTGAWDDTRLRFLNVPVLKCHGAYGVTAALKHHVGTMTTDLGTNTHAAVGTGGIGVFLSQVRMPDLNILDCLYVLADPTRGPASLYTWATHTGQIVASRDPVALDMWATTNILVPAMVANGHPNYPMQDPADPSSTFRRYLDLTADRILAAGIPVTNDLAHITAHVCSTVDVPRDSLARSATAYPNPFRSTTSIRFVAERGGDATLEVFDLGGRLRRSIHTSVARGAAHEIRWDGADQAGRPVSAGAYYYRLSGAGGPMRGRVTRVN